MWKYCILASFIFLVADSFQPAETVRASRPEIQATIGGNEDPQARVNFERQQLIEPKTGKIPAGIRKKEFDFSSRHQSRRVIQGSSTQWSFAGPNNVGGRTRAAAIDVLDLTGQTIIAGGVSGGIWKTTNGGNSWLRTSDPNIRNSITALAQDTRAGKENIWYFGTGELSGNSARSGLAPYRGDGIFKSTDNGDSWFQILSTQDSEPSRFGSQFQYTWRIVTDHSDPLNDVLLVATYGGILRSADGGESWETVLGEELNNLPDTVDLNAVHAPYYTDITKTADGIFYAYLSDFNIYGTDTTDFDYEKSGIYWSENGTDWHLISSGLTNESLNRVVLDARNSMLYAFAASGDIELLFRYDFEGTNLENKPVGTWSNLSSNLPDFEGIGALNTQSGYNMTLRIHPTDHDLILLGATNLYRSTSGFLTDDQTTWIGGYKEGSNATLYENHHPDQHEILFHPSDNNALYNANDGGIYLTNDIYEEIVKWSDLNKGYLTSQFYTVHIPKTENSDLIVGGMQDNGTYVRTSANDSDDWTSVLGGDGSFSSTVPDRWYWYFSAQEGQIYRFFYGEESTEFARVDPFPGPDQTGSEYLFINPFVLDPGNHNVMYLAAGNVIWKNSNLAQIPSGSTDRTDVNWEPLLQSRVGSGLISSVEITNNSKYLFYGTSDGEVHRLQNLDGAAIHQELVDFGDSQFVACVSSNPNDEDDIIVVISNYGVPSIYSSADAGENFIDISGNLEEFPDGSGSGPSIRWAEIVPLDDGANIYFIGTSVGLYSTTELNGSDTQWLKESENLIGKSVIRMMDYRPKDGTLAVASHGNGIFKTTVPGFKAIDPTVSNKPSAFVASNSFPNPFSDQTKIEFEIPETQFLRVDIYDMMGNHVKNLFIGPQFAGKSTVSWDGKNQHNEFVEDGMYLFRIYYDGLVKGGRVVFNR